MNVVWLKYPPVHVAATFLRHHFESLADEFGGKFHDVVAMVRVHNKVERPRLIATRDLAIRQNMTVLCVASDDACEALPTTLA